MSDPMSHFDNLICIMDFVPMSHERKEMVRQAASEIARLRLTDAEREAVDMAIDLLNGVEDVSAGASSRADAAAATLRGLLERMK